MQEMWVQSLVWEDPLKKEMATHPSILVWVIPMDRGAVTHRNVTCLTTTKGGTWEQRVQQGNDTGW